MEKIVAFTEYLKVLGYDFGDLKFQDAVALHTEVKEVIENHFKEVE